MSSENVIHIRLDQEEALKGKRSILFSEMGSLNVAKRIARYRDLRIDELGLKNRMYVKMKETKANIRKLQNLLPNPKIPRILKREQMPESSSEKEQRTDSYKDTDIESQLREIQKRLEKLQRENI